MIDIKAICCNHPHLNANCKFIANLNTYLECLPKLSRYDNQRWGQTAALTVRWLPDVSLIPVTGRRRPDVTSCDMSTLHSSSTASANWSWLDKGSSAPQSFRCLSERSSKVSNHFELISSLHPTPPPLPLFSLAFQYLPLCISFSEHPFMVCCYWRIWFNKEQFS